MPDTDEPVQPQPGPPRSLSSLRTIIDRTAVSCRLVRNELSRLEINLSQLELALEDESSIPEGDRQHAAKWRLLCTRLSIDPKVTHHTAIAHLRNPVP